MSLWPPIVSQLRLDHVRRGVGDVAFTGLHAATQHLGRSVEPNTNEIGASHLGELGHGLTLLGPRLHGIEDDRLTARERQFRALAAGGVDNIADLRRIGTLGKPLIRAHTK